MPITSLSPTYTVSSSFSRVTPLTGSTTVTWQMPFILLSSAMTVTVALPPLRATRCPLSLTKRICGSELIIEYALFVASAGSTFTVRSASSPFLISRADTLKPIDVTCCLTITSQVAEYPPSEVVTVIVALPALTAVITPFEETVATFVSELFHLTP